MGVMGVMGDGILGGTTVSWERLGKIGQSCAKLVSVSQADSSLTNMAGFQFPSSHSTMLAGSHMIM